MDFDLGEDAGALRARLRALVADHFPDEFLGVFTDDPDDLAATEVGSCRRLAGRGSAHAVVATTLRRRWRIAMGSDRRPRGDVGAPRAPRSAVHGAELGGPGDHGLRH